MKKLKFLFVIMLGILLIPFSVVAEDAVVNEDTNKKVNVYFFYGDGCPHCTDAEAFFESIQEEYGQYFTIVDYETWYDTSNADLMNKVAEARGETVEGVPYIIIGDQSWSGYATDYNDEIKSKIKEQYEINASERYDIMDYVDDITVKTEEKDNYAQDIMVVLTIILVIAGIVGGIWFARKKAA